MPIYIIEHLEEKLWPWCIIEYKHISQTIGKEHLWFTNVSSPKLKPYGKVISSSVIDLYPKLQNACVLDPAAKKILQPHEQFDYLVFGGILGDDPPRKRTEPELTDKMPGVVTRNIGKKQMSTDTAVYVVQQILLGTKLSELQFQDELEIPLGKNESTVLPYRYVVVDGKVRISPELVAFLKKNPGI
ncbi:MAG TPA: SAM-dependent methyltransferase [Candidatus Nanoarchaeia archaeon]|nr:SAM-dependent methyltransferase [Candidatus Nanoarchaeia archaeon]